MSLKKLIFFALIFPMIVQVQAQDETKAIKIEILQSLNKLESSLDDKPAVLASQRDNILSIMDREISKNNLLTENLMKIEGRSKAQREQIQAQLALTAKQKYIRRSFQELDWKEGKLSSSTTLELVRNFMNLVQ